MGGGPRPNLRRYSVGYEKSMTRWAEEVQIDPREHVPLVEDIFRLKNSSEVQFHCRMKSCNYYIVGGDDSITCSFEYSKPVVLLVFCDSQTGKPATYQPFDTAADLIKDMEKREIAGNPPFMGNRKSTSVTTWSADNMGRSDDWWDDYNK